MPLAPARCPRPRPRSEARRVVRAGLLDHRRRSAVGRPRALRPFLQRASSGRAAAGARRSSRSAEGALDERLRRLEAAVEEDRADHRLADVGEDRRLRRSPRCASPAPSLRSGPDVPAPRRPRRRSRGGRARPGGATARPRGAVGKAREEQLGDGKAEHPVAEEFQPLVALAAGAAGGADMGQGLRRGARGP